GTRIHASVGEQLIKQFEGKLTEGDAKVVQLFKMYDAIGDYRTTAHPYKIGFFHTNFVGTADEFPSEVPDKYFADAREVTLVISGDVSLIVSVGNMNPYPWAPLNLTRC
ncbi:hypothetical protein BRARA_B02648, partial [Brassica rapa]